MSRTDVLFRAYTEYLKVLEGEHDRECTALREAAVNAESRDRIRRIGYTCHISEDWVEAIDRGLVFIGKAIDEERQFIRSVGEVDPIEKVKRVSRESVEHLARHSNLLTREREDGELVPEKLYTVERLSNFAVYENRFLYMVLCHLRDFISVRYNAIVKKTNTYRGEADMKKTFTQGKTTLSYELCLRETRPDDPVLRERSDAMKELERVERILRATLAYLRTPLMMEVAKADKLKPPITKTNVLRMDKNFKEVVALYDYISSYPGDGYTIEEEVVEADTADRRIAAEFVEPVLLLSFLGYEYGLELRKELRRRYEEENFRRAEAENRRRARELERMRRRLKEEGTSPDEYILLLEKQVVELGRELDRIRALEAENIELKQQALALAEEMEALEKAHAEEVAELKQAHAEEVAGLNGHIAELEQAHAEEMEALKQAHSEEVAELNGHIAELGREMAQEAAAHAEALAEVNRRKEAELGRILSDRDNAVRKANERVQETNRMLEDRGRELEELERRSALDRARLLAIRKEHGLLTDADDYTSEEAFGELEHELEVLTFYARGEWKTAKQILHRELKDDIKEFFAQKFRKKPKEGEPKPPSGMPPASEEEADEGGERAEEALSGSEAADETSAEERR